MTPSTNGALDSGAELEAWQKMKKFEEGLKAGLMRMSDDVRKRATRASRNAKLGKVRDQPRTGGNREQEITSIGDALLWFVAND
jgi:hypothetical protein